MKKVKDRIKDLHGNIYELREYKLMFTFPEFTGITVKSISFNRDTITGRIMNIVETNNKHYAIFHLSHLGLYIKYQLTKIGYNPLEDIRKGYLHGNKYHS